MTIRTSEGGMICASVPEAAMIAGCEPAIVAVAQHDRQRNQTHRNNGGCDDAGSCGEQGADENDGIGEAAAHGAEQLPDRVEQVFRHAASFEDESHEGEERDRKQDVVAHCPVNALGQGLQKVGREKTELDSDDAPNESVGCERECHRITEQQEYNQ
jgi:hypothetical protein